MFLSEILGYAKGHTKTVFTNFPKSFQSIMSIIRRKYSLKKKERFDYAGYRAKDVSIADQAFNRQPNGAGLDTQQSQSVPFSQRILFHTETGSIQNKTNILIKKINGNKPGEFLIITWFMALR